MKKTNRFLTILMFIFLYLPMAVLINGNTYSAAEFFAAALREYDWAIVVGEKTSGKGHYQVVYQLSDGSAIGLSIGKYFTPKGVSLAEVGGITPDIVVDVDTETFNAIYAGTLEPMEDPQIAIAIYVEKGGHGSTLASIAKSMLDVYFDVDEVGDVVTYENRLS